MVNRYAIAQIIAKIILFNQMQLQGTFFLPFDRQIVTHTLQYDIDLIVDFVELVTAEFYQPVGLFQQCRQFVDVDCSTLYFGHYDFQAFRCPDITYWFLTHYSCFFRLQHW